MRNQAFAVQRPVSIRLPVTRSLALPYALSLLIAVLLILASAGGLLYQDAFYPTSALRLAYFIPFAPFLRGIVADEVLS